MAGEFAKLFGSGDDQVLAMLVQDDEGELAVRIFIDPKIEGLLVSNVTLGYNGEDEKAIVAFEKFTEEDAIKVRDGLRKELAEMLSPDTIPWTDDEPEEEDEGDE